MLRRTSTCLLLLTSAAAFSNADDEIDRYVRAAMELNSIPGLTLVAVVDHKLAFEKAYGVRSVDSGEPMTVDTPVELASVSKSLTALAILQLQQEGSLQGEQVVSEYLPELAAAADGGWRAVTIGHLLQHRSGLRRGDDFAVPCCGDPEEFDLDVAVSRIAEVRLASEPGEVFSYANANYILLAAVIERMSGRSFAEAMEERVFRQLGMTRTWVGRSKGARGQAKPHEWQWGRVRMSPSRFFGWLGASLVKSTTEDMGRYLVFLLGGSDGETGAAVGPELWNGLEKGYDLGWFVQAEASWLEGELALEHAGDIWGGNTAAILVPGRGAGVVVLTNLGTNRANRIARAVMRRLAGLEMPEPRRAAESESPDNWAMGFLAAAVLLFAGEFLYALRFRRQWRAGLREWSPNAWRTARAVLLAAMSAIVLYMLFGAAPPLAVFPSTVKVALPLLAFATAALLLLAGLTGLAPRRKMPAQAVRA